MKNNRDFIWTFSVFGGDFFLYIWIGEFLLWISDEARAKAISLYRILAAIQILLGMGLLICGGFGTKYTGEDDFGPPYFLGGFLVGSAVCACE